MALLDPEPGRRRQRKISGKRLGWEPGPIQVPGYALKFRLQKRRPANRGEIVGRIVDDAARGLICRTKSNETTPSPDSTITIAASRIQLSACLGRRDL